MNDVSIGGSFSKPICAARLVAAKWSIMSTMSPIFSALYIDNNDRARFTGCSVIAAF